MIPTWPPKPQYEAEKRLREAVNARAQADALADFIAAAYKSAREAAERLQAMQDAVAKALADIDALLAGLDTYSRTAKQARNIRDDLAAVLDESARP